MMLLNNPATSLLSSNTTHKPENITPRKSHGFNSKDLSKPIDPIKGRLRQCFHVVYSHLTIKKALTRRGH